MATVVAPDTPVDSARNKDRRKKKSAGVFTTQEASPLNKSKPDKKRAPEAIAVDDIPIKPSKGTKRKKDVVHVDGEKDDGVNRKKTKKGEMGRDRHEEKTEDGKRKNVNKRDGQKSKDDSETLAETKDSTRQDKVKGGRDKVHAEGRIVAGDLSKAKRKTSPPPAEEEWGGVGDHASEDHLHGFSTDDDSSDEDDDMDEPIGIDVGKLPTIAKDDATVKWKLGTAIRKHKGDHGVIFLGRIPHGFYEDQLRSYFTQFGDVTRLRLSRNKKTGHSKSYAFIEFSSSSVAQIVADTMDNYLLAGRILSCKVIPKDQVHPELWVGANRKWRVVPRDRISREAHNKPRTEAERMKTERRLIKRQDRKKQKLEALGIKYDFEPIAYVGVQKKVEGA